MLFLKWIIRMPFECEVALFTKSVDKGNTCVVVSGFRVIDENDKRLKDRNYDPKTLCGYYRLREELNFRAKSEAFPWDLQQVWLKEYTDQLTLTSPLGDITFVKPEGSTEKITRIQIWWRECLLRKRVKQQCRRLAFSMGSHERLGADSHVRCLTDETLRAMTSKI